MDRREEDGTVHTVPVNDEGIPLKPHLPSVNCVCHPEVEQFMFIHIIHNQLN